jgi:hypothetical protein
VTTAPAPPAATPSSNYQSKEWIISFSFAGIGHNTSRRVEDAIRSVFQHFVGRKYGGIVERTGDESYHVVVGVRAYLPGPLTDNGLHELFDLIVMRWEVPIGDVHIQERCEEDAMLFSQFIVQISPDAEEWSDVQDDGAVHVLGTYGDKLSRLC